LIDAQDLSKAMVFANNRCVVHPSKDALSFCQYCKEFFCEDCLAEAGDYYFCAKPACSAAGQQAVIKKKKAIRAAYAQWFCDSCLETTEESTGGKTFITMNGIGVNLFGKKARCPSCSSVVTRAWFCFLFVPILPFDRYRVIWLSGNRLVTRRLKK
jgi:B-box zinc finger